MHALRSLIKAIVFLAMVCAVATLHAQDGLSDALARLNFSRDINSGLLGPPIATADFNRDTHPDGAVLRHDGNTFHIDVHLRSRRTRSLTFASNLHSLAIASLDINHDGISDLVVEEPFSNRRLFIWLNDGNGFFHSVQASDFPSTNDDGFQRPALKPPSPIGSVSLTPARTRIPKSDKGLSHAITSVAIPHLLCIAAFDPAEPVSNSILRRGPPSSTLL